MICHFHWFLDRHDTDIIAMYLSEIADNLNWHLIARLSNLHRKGRLYISWIS